MMIKYDLFSIFFYETKRKVRYLKMEGKQRVSLGLVVILVLTLTILGCSTANETQTDRPIESDEGKEENGAQTEHLVAASQFPEKNIELLVIVGPGGSVDATARILSEGASKYLPNQSEIVVVNRPGGSGSVALTSLLNSEPDGYTLAIAGPSEIVTNYLLGTAQYTPDDFEYVLNAIATPLILVDREDSPWQSYQEWVEYVKNHPGQVRVGIVGKTSLGPLILQRLITAANLDFVLVPYEQGGPALAAMLAGELDGVLLSQATIRDVEGVRPLFTIAPERVQSLPDVPSINEHSGVD